jgi:CRISPR/Cas system-associated exonuclease Cas4 (RecB family)
MTQPAPSDTSEEGLLPGGPYLSHSRLSRYLHCPEQYRLYYVERLRLRVPAAALVFGQVVHMALSFHFRHGEDPVKAFEDCWNSATATALGYKKRESWESLMATGQALLAKFVREALPRITNVQASESRFELAIEGLDLPFVGVIDLVADLDGKSTVVDFKTSVSAYEDHEAALSDQLTAYQLAEPEAEQTALCVLVKTKEPRIEWFVEERRPGQLVEFLAKAEYVASEIAAARFYKRPGKWCAWCDYLPVCLGNEKAVEETLVRV